MPNTTLKGIACMRERVIVVVRFVCLFVCQSAGLLTADLEDRSITTIKTDTNMMKMMI